MDLSVELMSVQVGVESGWSPGVEGESGLSQSRHLEMMKMKMMKMKMMTPKVNEILTTFYIGVLLPSVYRFIAG